MVSFGFVLVFLGEMFRVMHWPNSHTLLYTGILVVLIFYFTLFIKLNNFTFLKWYQSFVLLTWSVMKTYSVISFKISNIEYLFLLILLCWFVLELNYLIRSKGKFLHLNFFILCSAIVFLIKKVAVILHLPNAGELFILSILTSLLLAIGFPQQFNRQLN